MDFGLDTLGSGAAKEQFDHVVQQVLDNIDDPNTEWKTPRVITMKVTFLPNEDRGQGKVLVSIKPTLAPIKPFSTTVQMGKMGGQMQIKEVDRLFPDPKPEASGGEKKVYKITHEGGSEG
jgi:hypothetical protein